MRVALVHDYLTHFGGAERVLASLMDIFPNATVFTLVYDRERCGMDIDERRVRTSFLQKMPGAKRSHRYVPLALMPLAIEQFDFSDYDIVFSGTHSFSKGIIVPPHTMHISYCFTPTRYAWDDSHKYIRDFSQSSLFQKFAPVALSYIRMWDFYASQRVNAYLTLSHHVERRIEKYYRRKADVIFPPVEVGRFQPVTESGEYYLVVSRLVPYKRVDLAIEVCERLRRPLKIVGTGPEMEDLKKIAGPHTEFLGFVPDEDLPDIYAKSKALLFPQEEDFGITPLEAAASGRPTVAYGAGGALETIKDKETGVFFRNQTISDMAKAVQALEGIDWDYAAIRNHAELYSKERFLREIGELVHNHWMEFKRQL